ncbi:LysR family transcriptional regulator [Acetobacter farinalis]|uniref:LysR family transcriptional regulator n=1 Tax=Acetobacter farinalis TaxID=1260984 RepID=A0ABT3Q5P6_9PROT|nr:LysR family transcriptional regulator [Acetobacter farinalis]MCX2560601.1 LysR family transcriptional regulator [Acetobacter farinalis]NHO29257.1 LysR family transcriptional regulator [Acetobacter farinalis]
MYTPKLSHLRFFCAIVETGSIAAAARHMHCVASNLTMRLRELEADLGQELFLRERKKLLITPAGRLFYEEAKEIVSRADRLPALWAQSRLRGILNVGALDVAFLNLLPRCVPRFMVQYPGIHLNVLQKPSFSLEKMLVEEEIDLAVTDGPVENTLLEGIFAFSETLHLVVPETISAITPELIEQSDMYLFDRDCFYRRCAEQWLERNGYQPRSILTLESYDLITQCLNTRKGLACMPESVIRQLRARGQALKTFRLEGVGPTDVYFVWRKHAKNPVIEKFLAVARAEGGTGPADMKGA